MNSNIQLYRDESLESFLLRLSQEQGYERFAHFAEELWYQTLDDSSGLLGAFPLELNRVNVYHAQTTSQMRVRVFIYLENQLKLSNFGVLRLTLTHSKSQFSPDFKAVHRLGVDYPYAFLRKRFTPVCPSCLSEASYIRQHWHLIPHQVCEKHGCELIHRCPECYALLEYQSIESITQCECGFHLPEALPKPASKSAQIVARWLTGDHLDVVGPMGKAMSISERYGLLLWYVNRYGRLEDFSLDEFVQYCAIWPKRLHQDLDMLAKKAELVRIKEWKQTFFSEIFGTLLKECRYLPSRQLSKNIVLAELLRYFNRLVADHPSSVKGNIADILLSPLEASTLLSCTTDEIYRLYEYGEIKAAVRPQMHVKIASHESVFTLRSVVETKLARMCSENDGLSVYLPEW
ncbi:TniQ family protein [Vibrio natriegens]|uniref:TniQ domain-containing protein n=1 Tax=Vibrio natriegens NBRC 15636 = ATCC 14048 = DSM 759 TaxID=1219067 RepID=A0AAN1CV16_VIBNA|nr:TniQ family protein [Vibrio natriegens]EJG1825677.1 TniQ family protein [Vibrio parahaemolyticus]ALR16072.1 hypothetical protein PN96_08750 [Vibrio natriegens NBRC 15636 = ATCC 14048 = DSM 759]ANQ12067.1 hypothetical protein BA890_04600 [Vibrio natriegens NBRC 15636 = ATCC 14048 = DSM 759]EPM42538.1 hypothetical protein M272_22035 [Vibrio natriegens NBRC 15636 = ATCC 14048 = DSM 759]MDX6026426.1 TniQ family protein [Vibrio natriegens NBRC 15636 = ATCC 14048 = DSM 759]